MTDHMKRRANGSMPLPPKGITLKQASNLSENPTQHEVARANNKSRTDGYSATPAMRSHLNASTIQCRIWLIWTLPCGRSVWQLCKRLACYSDSDNPSACSKGTVVVHEASRIRTLHGDQEYESGPVLGSSRKMTGGSPMSAIATDSFLLLPGCCDTVGALEELPTSHGRSLPRTQRTAEYPHRPTACLLDGNGIGKAASPFICSPVWMLKSITSVVSSTFSSTSDTVLRNPVSCKRERSRDLISCNKMANRDSQCFAFIAKLRLFSSLSLLVLHTLLSCSTVPSACGLNIH